MDEAPPLSKGDILVVTIEAVLPQLPMLME
jgi:hypothetical protein